MDSKIAKAVQEVFVKAQQSFSLHPTLLQQLTALFYKDPESFLTAFLPNLNRVLIIFARELPVERLITFVAQFAAQDRTQERENMRMGGRHHQNQNREMGEDGVGAQPDLSMIVMTYLLSKMNGENKAVRYRVAQLLAQILNMLPEDADIDDEIWIQLTKNLILRAKDKIPRIRAMAMSALHRLQDLQDPANDQVTKTLLHAVENDSSAMVRKAALVSLAVSEVTVPYIMQRVRDVKEDVRKAAYSVLSSKVDPRSLSILDRIQILNFGMQDRSDTVRKCCIQTMLVKGWFQGACESNHTSLVQLLDGELNQEPCLIALRNIFTVSPTIDIPDLDVNNLTTETVLVLRGALEGLDLKTKADLLDDNFPQLIDYGEVLKYYKADPFIIQHLLEIAKHFDFADESGRRLLIECIRVEFLSDFTVADLVISKAVEVLYLLLANDGEFHRAIIDLILNENNELLDGADNQDFLLTNIEKKYVRSLILVESMLSCTKSNDTIQSIFAPMLQHVLLPGLTSTDEFIRAYAIRSLALYCLLDTQAEEMKVHLNTFVQALSTDTLPVKTAALKAVLDFLLVFHLQEETPSNSKGSLPKGDTIQASLLNLVKEYLHDPEADLRTYAAEGLAKLLFAKRTKMDSQILSRLVILNFSPMTEDDTRLRQCLAVFFPTYAFSSGSNRLLIENIFLRALEALDEAPNTSPLYAVNQVQVAQYLTYLTDKENQFENLKYIQDDSLGVANEIHERLALLFLNKIIDLESNNQKFARLCCRVLNGLRIECHDSTNVIFTELINLCRVAVVEIEDKQCLATLKKFLISVEEKLQTYESKKQSEQNTAKAEPQISDLVEIVGKLKLEEV